METITAIEWLYTTLGGDGTLTGLVGTRIYRYPAPKTATFPLVLFQVQSGRDLMVVNARRVWSDLVVLVRGVAKSDSPISAETIADRIDTLIHRASGTGVVGCVREEPFELVEVIDGVRYQHVGGLYRIYVQ